jgi:hypothetical protein
VAKVDSFPVECVILYFYSQEAGTQNIKENPGDGPGDNQHHGQGKRGVPVFDPIGEAVNDFLFPLVFIFASKMAEGQRQAEYHHKNERWKHIQHDMLEVQQIKMSHGVSF